MDGAQFLQVHAWHPLRKFNINHAFFDINKDTIIYTWMALLLLLLLIAIARFFLYKKESLVRYVTLTFIQSFTTLTKQTLGYFSAQHFYFITSLFCFIVLCNCITLIPWTDEPTKDINTTLALGIISFLYIQYFSIKAHGAKNYIKEYFSPFFVMFPLHVISKISSIISLSFRLFGNIFGGAVIATIYLSAIRGSIIFESIGLLSGLNLGIMFFFVVFEGVLQAFVFAMLTLTYLAIAIAGEEPVVGDLP